MKRIPTHNFSKILRCAALAGCWAFAMVAGEAPGAYAGPDFHHVRTESGRLRCIIHTDRVACEASGPGSAGFPQAPLSEPESQCRNPCPGGIHFDIAEVKSAGAFQFEDANIGGGGTPQNDLVLNYGQAYHLLGWTIDPGENGTRITNDGTGHGMFVSIEHVSSF
jgi:hypothetical protein